MIMEPSVFTKIIRGELPSHKVYEDELTLAFLTISPLTEGHVLVVPKNQVDDFEKLPDEDYRALFSTVKKVAERVKEIYGTKKAIVSIMGYEVPHAHVHVMPFGSESQFYDAVENRHKATVPSAADLSKVAERLKF